MTTSDAPSEYIEMVGTLNADQRKMFDIMNNESLHQFRIPTGGGKGYVMIVHILNTIATSDENKIFAICSHRLSLNNQHLRDIIEQVIYQDLLPKTRFLTIGSQRLNATKVLRGDPDLNKKYMATMRELNKDTSTAQRLITSDIFKGTLSEKDADEILTKNRNQGLHTVIVSTYHSLGKLENNKIDYLYLDEAHTLANETESEFKVNFEKVEADNKFFFSATPRDIEDQYFADREDDEIFLMNNETIFGKSFEVPFVKCIREGYIVKPILHIAKPDVLDYDKDYESVGNKVKFIYDTFYAHAQWLKGVSGHPELIEPKVLVRCGSVPEMWELHSILKDNKRGITVCAGASYNDRHAHTHVIGDRYISSRDDFLKEIQSLSGTEKVVILNYDIFSEGINVSGITATLFLQGKLPTITKVIQNVGRATRLHPYDRQRLATKEIHTNDYRPWVKPYCAVVLPFWDVESSEATKSLGITIRQLRDSWEFNPHFVVSVGNDLGLTNDLSIDEQLNTPRRRKSTELIEHINNYIEDADELERQRLARNQLRTLQQDDFFSDALVHYDPEDDYTEDPLPSHLTAQCSDSDGDDGHGDVCDELI